MALPIPHILLDPTETERTKFTPSGSEFQFLVAIWPTTPPPDPPEYDIANDRYREGDNAAVSHILYRVIENRATVDTDVLLDATRDAILADAVQRPGWQQYLTTFYYRDVVLPIADPAIGKHVGMMPTTGWGIDATTRCYWVVAWLGRDSDNILTGYDLTP